MTENVSWRIRAALQGAVLIVAWGASTLPVSAEDVLRVGAAKREITPTEPVPMWGYGARHDKLSTGVIDPLHAAAVVIQVGSRKLAVVGLDLGRSPSESSLQRIREVINTKAGIDYSMISGSHTHHGPVVELSDEDGKGRGRFDATIRYIRKLEDAIVEAILDADQRLAPAKIATGGTSLVDFNRNRHSKLDVKPLDTMLGVMRFDDVASDKTIAVLVNFAAHPTSIPAQALEFSADYVGALKGTVEKELGGTAVFMQGASGDLSTERGPHGDHVAYGQALGRETVKLARSLKPMVVDKPSLTVREDRFRFDSRTNFNNPLVLAAYSIAFFPELVRNFVDEYQDGIRPRLTVALLNGQIALVSGSEIGRAHV